MKKLEFSYRMRICFDQPIESHRFTVKCIPKSTARQTIEQMDIKIYPNEFLSEDQDSFGNKCIYGFAKSPHQEFWIELSGQAITGVAEYEELDDVCHAGIYKYQSEYTKPGKCIQLFADGFHFSKESNLEKACFIMDKIYQEYKYVQGVTTVSTMAEEAMSLGCGVCQDYAHIMLSLCRIQHIPSRYIVGLLMGEGRSHAWVEILTEDGKWIGIDPTNHQIVGDDYLKISNGRDYGDCTINQGYFTGMAAQTQKIWAILKEQEQ